MVPIWVPYSFAWLGYNGFMIDDAPLRTLVLGLGNPIRGDDGVGWRVVEAVIKNLPKVKKPSEGKSESTDPPPPLQGHPKRCALPQEGREQNIEVDMLSGGGLNLMERLVGYDRAILVDAIQGGNAPGSVQVFQLEALENPSAGHLGSTHETNLLTALEIGRSLGAHLPPVGGVMVVAVEAQPVFEFSEELSPAVEKALPEAVQKVMNLLNLC
jgi:hydrogenase maturation protease